MIRFMLNSNHTVRSFWYFLFLMFSLIFLTLFQQTINFFHLLVFKLKRQSSLNLSIKFVLTEIHSGRIDHVTNTQPKIDHKIPNNPWSPDQLRIITSTNIFDVVLLKKLQSNVSRPRLIADFADSSDPSLCVLIVMIVIFIIVITVIRIRFRTILICHFCCFPDDIIITLLC